MNNAVDHINMELINDKDLLELFNQLETKIQNDIVWGGIRKAAGIILKEQKLRFNQIKKQKSKENYSKADRSFRIEKIKSQNKEDFGVRIYSNYYKMRWLEWGTVKRYTKSKRAKLFKRFEKKVMYRGQINKSSFFYGAFADKEKEAFELISKSVVESFEKMVRKLNKTNI